MFYSSWNFSIPHISPPILEHRISFPHGLSGTLYVFCDTLKRHKSPAPRHFTTTKLSFTHPVLDRLITFLLWASRGHYVSCHVAFMFPVSLCPYARVFFFIFQNVSFIIKTRKATFYYFTACYDCVI